MSITNASRHLLVGEMVMMRDDEGGMIMSTESPGSGDHFWHTYLCGLVLMIVLKLLRRVPTTLLTMPAT